MPRFADIKQMSYASYQTTIEWERLEKELKELKKFGLDMNPDFQRGHVWNESQQIKYVEWILRGGKSGRDIYFNCSKWMHWGKTLPQDMVLVDGLQRITAVLRFLHNEIRVFGYFYKEYTDSLRMIQSTFTFHINDLETRNEVLQWYIDFNSGGTVHKESEIERVRKMMK